MLTRLDGTAALTRHRVIFQNIPYVALTSRRPIEMPLFCQLEVVLPDLGNAISPLKRKTRFSVRRRLGTPSSGRRQRLRAAFGPILVAIWSFIILPISYCILPASGET
jgi:hypothetical protein